MNQDDYRPSYGRSSNNRSFPTSRSRGNIDPSRRQKFFMIGDMVQIVDEQHDFYGKFGLVERLNPAGQDWQVLIKIGRDSIGAFFRQARFCTRIQRGVRPGYHRTDSDARNGARNNRDSSDEQDIHDMIDPLDELP